MVSLIPYALAGAAAGAGEGLTAQSRRDFEALQEELRNKRQVARDEANRAHQTSEREASQAFRSTEAETERGWRTTEAATGRAHDTAMQTTRLGHASSEAEKDRNWRGTQAEIDAGRQTDRFQDDSGNWWVRSKDGTSATPLTGTDGKQLAGKMPRDPNELTKSQQYLAYQRALKDNTTKNLDDPTVAASTDWGGVISDLQVAGIPITPSIAARAERDVRQQLAPAVKREAERRRGEENLVFPDKPADYGGLTRDQWEKQELDRRVAERMVELGLSAGEAVPAPSSAATGQASTAQLAPAAPAQRTVGQVYRNAAGKRAEWTGEGWRPVD